MMIIIITIIIMIIIIIMIVITMILIIILIILLIMTQMGNTKLLAKLWEGDMIAKEAWDDEHCITKFRTYDKI